MKTIDYDKKIQKTKTTYLLVQLCIFWRIETLAPWSFFNVRGNTGKLARGNTGKLARGNTGKLATFVLKISIVNFEIISNKPNCT